MVDKGDPLFGNVWNTLSKKDSKDLQKVVDLAITDRDFLQEVLDGLVSTNETYRYNCSKVITKISENVPLKIYCEWDYFVELIRSENAFHRMIAVTILANLTPVDTEEKFEPIANYYFSLLDGKSLIAARYVAARAGIIAQAKPALQEKITRWLLKIEKTHHENKDLILFDAIESFDEYFDQVNNKEKILKFVKKQLNCSSPKSRKRAQEFLDKYQVN
jgi:hypothetical protein